ncbi:MAG: AMP-dependent synthetase [Chloroflexi bacterium]|nr:MAG: AMP-dependent synthetase [Chloroflexota bacterium]RLC87943.1 MAG: AMP-dependent synthetase [Chloroflexota bacterium]
MLVQDFLQNSAERFPNKTALICDGHRLTYAEIEARANRLAHALIAHGVQRGDRVVIYMPNSVEAAIAIFAILKAAGTFVVVNPTTKRDKLIYILNNCRATALFTTDRNAPLAADLHAAVPSLQFTVLSGKRAATAAAEGETSCAFDDLLAAYPASRPACPTIDQDIACLIYTSGSTGDPKGVVEGHNNVVFASGSIIQYLENTSDDIVINVLPLSFDYGLYQLLMVFRFGGTLVLEKSFAYPAAVLRKMEAERVTGFPGVPTIFAILLQMDLSPYDLSSLRYLTNTAAALPPSHITALREKFPWATLYSMYGLTECKRTLYLPPDQLDKHPGSVGIAIPGTEVWIEDEEGNRVGPGVVGELVIRGSHVMRGYWENPEATAARYRPGPTPGERVLYSGDLFKMDEEGYLYFVARKDDIIKSRGEKVAPKEIENVLYGLEGVVEAAVIGVPDPILGQAIKAFVVLEGIELTEKDILRHCRAHLEDFMLPQYIEFRDSLPKTSSGKIKKTELR